MTASESCQLQSKSNPEATIWIACSGGLDSCVLLDITAKWALQYPDLALAVIHVNHQLSANATAWQQHVEELAKSYKLKCVSKRVSVTIQARSSLESQARDARYKAMFESFINGDVLLLGHHLDDQVETIFLRLLRGSGPKGLAGMRPKTRRLSGMTGINLVRPLLSTARTDLENYARHNQLRWVTDESNQNVQYDRNMLRHKWFNVAQQYWAERWPGMQRAIARSAYLCDQQQTTLDLLLAEKLQHVKISPQTLSKSTLLSHPKALQICLLRYWFEQLTDEAPSAAVLTEMQSALTCENDRSPIIAWGSHEWRVHADTIYFLRHSYTAKSVYAVLAKDQYLECQDDLGRSIHISCQFIQTTLTITLSHQDDAANQERVIVPGGLNNLQAQSVIITNQLSDCYFTANAKGKSRQLKRWFKDWKTPPWYRNDVVGVFVDDTLVAIIEGNKIKLNRV